MEPGRLGLRIFLALLNNKPLESELTPQEYEACMEMARRHTGKRPCIDDVVTPKPKPKPKSKPKPKPKPKPSSLLHVKKPTSPPKKKKTNENPVPEPQPLPGEYQDALAKKGAKEVKLIHVKRLTNTDTDAHQDRLLMTPLEGAFLTPQEESNLFGVKGYKINVDVMGPSLEKFDLQLSFWNGKYIVICHRWKRLVEANRLVPGDVIQVWSFRVGGGTLGLLIHRTKSAGAMPSGSKAAMDVDDDGDDMVVVSSDGSGGSGSKSDHDQDV